MALMSLKEASEYLKVAPRTLYNWSSRKRIPTVKIGGLKFIKDDLDVLIEKSRRS